MKRPRRMLKVVSAAALLAGAVTLASAQPAPAPAPPAAGPPSAAQAARVQPQDQAPAPIQSSAQASGVAPSAAPAIAPALPQDEPPPSGLRTESDAEAPTSGVPAKPEPPKRTLYTAAIIQVLDKVTAQSLKFEAPLHKFIRYKGLIFQVNTCQTDSADPPVTAAHLEIDSQPPAMPGHPQNAVKMVFRGWMFADAPGPHPFEHPIYDVWLIACRMAAPGA